MFSISNQQINAFNIIKPSVFESKMEAHAAEYFPQQCHIMGKAGLKKLVIKGYTDAKKYGIITSADLCIYIDLMIMLGHEFTTDPQLPWVAETFGTGETINDPKPLHKAYYRAIAFFEKTGVEDQLLPEIQWMKIMQWSFKKMEQAFKKDFFKTLPAFLETLWPQKYNNVNKPLQVYDAIEEAKKIGFTASVNVAYYCILRFLLGYRFASDPQYPWMVNALHDETIDDEEYKARYLHTIVQKHGEMLTGYKTTENFNDQLN